MGYIEEVSCDVCGKVKGKTNHWFLASPKGENGNSIVLLPFDMEWLKQATPEFPRDVICGEECLHKWISQHAAELHSAVKPPLNEVCVCKHPVKNFHEEGGCLVSFCDCKYTQNDIPNDMSLAAQSAAPSLSSEPNPSEIFCSTCQKNINGDEWYAHLNGHRMEEEQDRTRAYRTEENLEHGGEDHAS